MVAKKSSWCAIGQGSLEKEVEALSGTTCMHQFGSAFFFFFTKCANLQSIPFWFFYISGASSQTRLPSSTSRDGVLLQVMQGVKERLEKKAFNSVELVAALRLVVDYLQDMRSE